MADNKDLEFELVDELDETNEEETSELTNDSDNTKEVSEETKSSSNTKGAKSNFKKLSKAYKELKKEREELKEQLTAAQKDKEDDFSDLDFDDEDEVETETRTDSKIKELEFEILKSKEPEFAEYEVEVKAVMQEHTSLDYNTALVLAKSKRPVSTDKQDFSLGSTVVKPKKTLADLSEAEALQLSNSDYLKWTRVTE